MEQISCMQGIVEGFQIMARWINKVGFKIDRGVGV